MGLEWGWALELTPRQRNTDCRIKPSQPTSLNREAGCDYILLKLV
jgi:hypothetical protein